MKRRRFFKMLVGVPFVGTAVVKGLGAIPVIGIPKEPVIAEISAKYLNRINDTANLSVDYFDYNDMLPKTIRATYNICGDEESEDIIHIAQLPKGCEIMKVRMWDNSLEPVEPFDIATLSVGYGKETCKD